MYDEKLFQEAMAAAGLSPYRISLKSNVDPKTAKKVVLTGTGRAESVYEVAKVLGFKVRKYGVGKDAKYDLSVVVKHGRKSA